jgi:hypothetical protein
MYSTPTSLGQFLRKWRVVSGRQSGPGGTRANGLFPCRAPCQVTWRLLGEERWLRADAHTKCVRAYACMLVGVSSYLALGSKKHCPASLQPASSRAHLSMLRSVLERVSVFVSLVERVPISAETGRKGPVAAAALSRAASVAANAAAELGTLRALCADVTGSARRMLGQWVRDVDSTALVPMRACRVAYPARAATWDISQWLKGFPRDAFYQPRLLARADPPKPPRAKIRGPLVEWTGIVHRVSEGDGCEYLDEDEVQKDADGLDIKAGSFTIHKSSEVDRLVTNDVPGNTQEISLGLAALLLAHAVCLCDIYIPDGCKMRGSGRDLPDCYHYAGVPFERAKTAAVGPWLDPRDFVRYPAYARLIARRRARGIRSPPERITPAWTSLPMGDLNAVDFMQLAHMSMLRAGGALTDSSLMTYARPIFETEHGVRDGVVVDDYHVSAVVPIDLPASAPAADTRVLELVDRTYADQEPPLTPKPSKCYDHLELYETWGATVDGLGGTTRAGVPLLVRLALLTLRMLTERVATPRIWDTVVGLFGYAFLFRRMAYSLFMEVFHEARDLRPGEVFRPSAKGSVELECALALLPLLSANNRAPVSAKVWATDATRHRAACVSTTVPERTASFLWRARVRKGGRDALASLAKLLSADMPGELDPAERRRAANAAARDALGIAEDADGDAEAEPHLHAWPSAFCDALGWEPVFCYDVNPDDHVSRSEARPRATLIRRLARDPAAHGTKAVAFFDNSPNVFAWSKGRSKTPLINHCIRAVLPEALMADVDVGTLHCRSAAMPADAPTRRKKVRSKPVRVPPGDSALGRLLCGDWDDDVALHTALGTCHPLPASLFSAGERPNLPARP